jgi:hypothetical protein
MNKLREALEQLCTDCLTIAKTDGCNNVIVSAYLVGAVREARKALQAYDEQCPSDEEIEKVAKRYTYILEASAFRHGAQWLKKRIDEPTTEVGND